MSRTGSCHQRGAAVACLDMKRAAQETCRCLKIHVGMFPSVAPPATGSVHLYFRRCEEFGQVKSPA